MALSEREVESFSEDEARAELDRLVTEANALLDPYGAKAQPLKEAAHFIAYRKK